MWARLRLDIQWFHLIRGIFDFLPFGTRSKTQKKLEDYWSLQQDDVLACLSLRSGFDLYLQALELPAGSEVLFSSITISDMPRIAEAHGLVPIPVDLSGCNFQLDLASLENAITAKSKVLVVAYLFGARPDLSQIIKLARERDLLIVEDCAQAWHAPDWRGNADVDATFFSFGNIKTATALGGSLCRIGHQEILDQMRELQEKQPVQVTWNRPVKLIKYAMLKILSTRVVYYFFCQLCRFRGRDLDVVLRGFTKGFSESDLLFRLRKRPSCVMMRMMYRGLKTYDTQRIEQRIQNAHQIIEHLELQKVEYEPSENSHSYWLFPYFCSAPDQLVLHLRQHGFDTTQRGRMEVLSPPDERPNLICPQATELLNQTVLLPCYPEMSDSAINQMCDLIIQFNPQQSFIHDSTGDTSKSKNALCKQ